MFSDITGYATLLDPFENRAYQRMDSEHFLITTPSFSSSSSSHHEYGDIGPSVSFPPASSQLEETQQVLVQQEGHHHHVERQPSTRLLPHHRLLRFSVSHRLRLAVLNLGSTTMREDICSCLLVLSTFWFFTSMTLILGFYGSFELQLGPNCSYLIEASPIFVRSIEAQQIGVKRPGAVLYGFHKAPPRYVNSSWSQNHTSSIEPFDHAEWAYFLNAGSRLEISYEVASPTSAPVPLVIAQGSESLREWIAYPSSPGLVLSWNIIHGSGKISRLFEQSDTYFVAVGKLNSDTVTVHLSITAQSVAYNTSDAHFQCSLSDCGCSFKLHIQRPNAAVLTSPGTAEVKGDDGWYVKVSYGPRWLTYLGGSCIMTAAILLVFIFTNIIEPNGGGLPGYRAHGAGHRDPLLSPKSNGGLSDGSSYDCISTDEDDLEEKYLEASMEGKVPKEGEIDGNPRRSCVICYDAPRECFFLPCGHCATCFACGVRIAEDPGVCPICRRKMKKVRKIFPV